MLRQLEPIEIEDGQVLMKSDVENVSEVYLMMKGEIMVGYNHKRYILELNIDSIDLPFDQHLEAYSMLKSRIAQNLV